MDGLHAAIYLSAAVGLAGFVVLVFKTVVGIGRMVNVVEKMPGEMEGIRAELKKSSENSQLLLQRHGEDIAVIKSMLNLHDAAEANEGPRVRRRRGRGGREI